MIQAKHPDPNIPPYLCLWLRLVNCQLCLVLNFSILDPAHHVSHRPLENIKLLPSLSSARLQLPKMGVPLWTLTFVLMREASDRY